MSRTITSKNEDCYVGLERLKQDIDEVKSMSRKQAG